MEKLQSYLYQKFVYLYDCFVHPVAVFTIRMLFQVAVWTFQSESPKYLTTINWPFSNTRCSNAIWSTRVKLLGLLKLLETLYKLRCTVTLLKTIIYRENRVYKALKKHDRKWISIFLTLSNYCIYPWSQKSC